MLEHLIQSSSYVVTYNCIFKILKLHRYDFFFYFYSFFTRFTRTLLERCRDVVEIMTVIDQNTCNGSVCCDVIAFGRRSHWLGRRRRRRRLWNRWTVAVSSCDPGTRIPRWSRTLRYKTQYCNIRRRITADTLKCVL